jgi:hypothetical protein
MGKQKRRHVADYLPRVDRASFMRAAYVQLQEGAEVCDPLWPKNAFRSLPGANQYDLCGDER